MKRHSQHHVAGFVAVASKWSVLSMQASPYCCETDIGNWQTDRPSDRWQEERRTGTGNQARTRVRANSSCLHGAANSLLNSERQHLRLGEGGNDARARTSTLLSVAASVDPLPDVRRTPWCLSHPNAPHRCLLREMLPGMQPEVRGEGMSGASASHATPPARPGGEVPTLRQGGLGVRQNAARS
jgi:hypothetical protein